MISYGTTLVIFVRVPTCDGSTERHRLCLSRAPASSARDKTGSWKLQTIYTNINGNDGRGRDV